MFDPGELDRFVPIDGIEIPAGPSYLVEDVDTGHEFKNVAPNDALDVMLERGRSPLTVEEGIALVAQHPEILRKNFCFSLPGSRCGDKRVPGDLDLGRCRQGGVVLGREPAHLARQRVVRSPPVGA